MEQKYVTFQLHKNFEKKRVKKGYYKIFDQECQKNQNFKFDQKFQKFYSTLFLPFFFKIFVGMKSNILVPYFHIYNIKNG